MDLFDSLVDIGSKSKLEMDVVWTNRVIYLRDTPKSIVTGFEKFLGVVIVVRANTDDYVYGDGQAVLQMYLAVPGLSGRRNIADIFIVMYIDQKIHLHVNQTEYRTFEFDNLQEMYEYLFMVIQIELVKFFRKIPCELEFLRIS